MPSKIHGPTVFDDPDRIKQPWDESSSGEEELGGYGRSINDGGSVSPDLSESEDELSNCNKRRRRSGASGSNEEALKDPTPSKGLRQIFMTEPISHNGASSSLTPDVVSSMMQDVDPLESDNVDSPVRNTPKERKITKGSQQIGAVAFTARNIREDMRMAQDKTLCAEEESAGDNSRTDEKEAKKKKTSNRDKNGLAIPRSEFIIPRIKEDQHAKDTLGDTDHSLEEGLDVSPLFMEHLLSKYRRSELRAFGHKAFAWELEGCLKHVTLNEIAKKKLVSPEYAAEVFLMETLPLVMEEYGNFAKTYEAGSSVTKTYGSSFLKRIQEWFHVTVMSLFPPLDENNPTSVIMHGKLETMSDLIRNHITQKSDLKSFLPNLYLDPAFSVSPEHFWASEKLPLYLTGVNDDSENLLRCIGTTKFDKLADQCLLLFYFNLKEEHVQKRPLLATKKPTERVEMPQSYFHGFRNAKNVAEYLSLIWFQMLLAFARTAVFDQSDRALAGRCRQGLGFLQRDKGITLGQLITFVFLGKLGPEVFVMSALADRIAFKNDPRKSTPVNSLPNAYCHFYSCIQHNRAKIRETPALFNQILTVNPMRIKEDDESPIVRLDVNSRLELLSRNVALHDN